MADIPKEKLEQWLKDLETSGSNTKQKVKEEIQNELNKRS